jgi:hypothetical protein
MMEYWNTEMAGSQRIGMIECWNNGENIGIMEYWNIGKME